MSEKELDDKIDRWCKRMYITHPSEKLLALYAVKYGYKLAKREYKKPSNQQH